MPGNIQFRLLSQAAEIHTPYIVDIFTPNRCFSA
jgi:hypothetical protein